MIFIDCVNSKEEKIENSYKNECEMELIINLIKNIREKFKDKTIGVICAYKA